MAVETQVYPWEFENVQTISRDELQSKLREVKGCRAVSVVMVTAPAMNKKVNGEANPFYGRVQKRTYRSVMIGFRYENSVNNQRQREEKETDFVALPRRWGVHIEGTPLIEHEGNLYLECKVERVIGNQYLLDGEVVEDEVVKPYLAVRKQSSRQEVDNEVILIDVKLENIETIVMNGDTYTIVKGEDVKEEDAA
jgi:hypothetical protein